jgi:hypothetical protein
MRRCCWAKSRSGFGEAACLEAVVHITIEGQHGRAGICRREGPRPLGVAGHVESRQGVGQVHQAGHLGVGQLAQAGNQLRGIVQVIGLGETGSVRGATRNRGPWPGDSTKIIETVRKIGRCPILSNRPWAQGRGSRWVVTSRPGNGGFEGSLDLVEQGVSVALTRPVARHQHDHLQETTTPRRWRVRKPW